MLPIQNPAGGAPALQSWVRGDRLPYSSHPRDPPLPGTGYVVASETYGAGTEMLTVPASVALMVRITLPFAGPLL